MTTSKGEVELRRSIILAIILVLTLTPLAWGLTDTKEIGIIIDLTPPEVTITGTENGKAYSAPIIPAVTATDNNVAVNLDIALGRFNEPVNWLSGQEIAEYGNYILTAIATDKAGNKAIENVAFTLETWAGEAIIKIDKNKYTTGETMTITVIDLNKTGQGSVKIESNGLKNTSEITLTETSPGVFTGRYTFSGATMSGAFELKYNYKGYSLIAKGNYEVSAVNIGSGTGENKIKEEIKEKPINTEYAPGAIIGKVTGSEAKASSSDTAVFKIDSNGNYVYVPTIYDPNTGKHIVLNQEEGEELLLIQLSSQGANEWVNPAQGWLEQRRIIAEVKSDSITKDEVARLLENSTGTKGVLITDTGSVTAAEINNMITQVLDVSPLGKYVDRTEIDKWAKDRQLINKPITRQEVLVTTYWFLQNIK